MWLVVTDTGSHETNGKKIWGFFLSMYLQGFPSDFFTFATYDKLILYGWYVLDLHVVN